VDDLVAFLNARLDEREALALAAKENERRWRYSEGGGAVMLVDGGYVAVGPYGCDIDEDYGRHIAVNDPAYVLAEVDAKRQIIELHHPYQVTTSNDGLNWDYARCVACEPADRELEPGESYWPCPTLCLLALPFADHPDYQGSWRP
jgi:hypothetical protein